MAQPPTTHSRLFFGRRFFRADDPIEGAA
jgi:hypothetical protein